MTALQVCQVIVAFTFLSDIGVNIMNVYFKAAILST